ncbi:MAG: hypothetical protein IJI98_03795 [Methanosphaera sp.]|nr:hypothetical protein [Methanosphaera sp.]
MYKLNSWNEKTSFNVSKIANNYQTVQTACGTEIVSSACGGEVSTACGSEVVSSACGGEVSTACDTEITVPCGSERL